VEKRGRSSKPFSVQAGDLTVQVLGTQFSVEWLDDRIQVAVREGSVRVVSRQGEEKILNASECVSFQNDKIGQSQPIAPEQIAPWSRSLIREETSNQHLRRLMREYFPSRLFDEPLVRTFLLSYLQ
jgi:ferric-dicitrate binding protein FerR (iron transport regulator)